jgi:hypothetical protein
VALLKDVLANVNATSGIVPYTLQNKQSARRVFVFLKQIVGAMAMAGTPQKMAPRVLESFVEKYATRAARIPAGEHLLHSMTSYEDFTSQNPQAHWEAHVNAFLLSALTSQLTDDLQEILSGFHGMERERERLGELALAFFARITANLRLFPGLDKDSLISKRIL